MNKRNGLFIGLGIVCLGLIVGWFVLSSTQQTDTELWVTPTQGNFEVVVTTTGELRAKNSTEIKGPTQAARLQIYELKISKLVPEGTVVDSGSFVAELDKADLRGKMQESEINVAKVQSQYTQAILDTALTLSQERNNMVNLKFGMEEKLAEIEQSRFEAPATQRKVKLEFEKAKRSYEQAVTNYQKQIAKAVAKVKEAESDLNKELNVLNDLKELEKSFTIFAPSNGMIIYKRDWGGRKREVGSSVRPWDPAVATLPDLSIMESVTYVNEIDIRKVQKGQTVQLGLRRHTREGAYR